MNIFKNILKSITNNEDNYLGELIGIFEFVKIDYLQEIIIQDPNKFIHEFDTYLEVLLPLCTLSFWITFQKEYCDYGDFYKAFDEFIFTGECYFQFKNVGEFHLKCEKLARLREYEQSQKVIYIDYFRRRTHLYTL